MCSAKVIDREHVSWRGHILHVPRNLKDDFADVLFELCAGMYKFLGTYDVKLGHGVLTCKVAGYLGAGSGLRDQY